MYAGIMRSAGEATRRRILAEAKKEFAEHGLAGARINRIAVRARASKERLYAYFPSKEALFEAVSGQWVADVAEEAALAGDDVPEYVGRLFDIFVSRPDNVRLEDWVSLEVRDAFAADDWRLDAYEPKLAEIRRGQREGYIDPGWSPVHLVVLLAGIAKSMAAPVAFARGLALRTGAADLVADRRAAAVKAAEQLIRPT
jgi:AcrR family transcriptional regulator